MIVLAALALASSASQPVTVPADAVSRAYERWFERDWKLAEATSENPGMPLYPMSFSRAKCTSISSETFDCAFKVKEPLNLGWRVRRAEFTKLADGSWTMNKLI